MKVDNGTPTYYAYNAANELTEETTGGQTTYYQYDRCGNTVAKQEASGTTYYTYDTENLGACVGTLSRIDFPDGSHNYFAYDADSKRVSARTSEGYTEFVYQGPDMLKLLLERDEEGETQAHYTMGNGLETMPRANGDGIAPGDSSFYHYNHLGTTHELTDAEEAVTDTYRHDAWGVQLARTGTTLNPHTYVGRERYYRMPEAGLYHLGFREYAARTGRFTTVDPLLHGFLRPVTASMGRPRSRRGVELGVHLLLAYTAVRNHATAVSDPLGLLSLCREITQTVEYDLEAYKKPKKRGDQPWTRAWGTATRHEGDDCSCCEHTWYLGTSRIKIHCGGEYPGFVYCDVEELDPVKDVWDALPIIGDVFEWIIEHIPWILDPRDKFISPVDDCSIVIDVTKTRETRHVLCW